MPLPASVARTEMHKRTIEMRGYRRDDGLFDIEGRVVDTKADVLHRLGGGVTPANTPIHDMWIRLTVDDDLTVRDIVAVTDSTPFVVCREAVAPMAVIVGERIRPGWSNLVKSKLGGAAGCTHLMELLLPLATTAFQTLHPVRVKKMQQEDPARPPSKLDSCYAYAANREVVATMWPAFYTGQEKVTGIRHD